MNKEFDCVELQRKIRNEFIEEAENNFDKLIIILEKKIKDSDINTRLLERKKQPQLHR
ncbi:MAG: hypothetical protein ABSG15_02915 [FCB group bacterium]|jgi:hypothetical protein